MGAITWKGFVPDTDPRYSQGSTIIVGPNLNQPLVAKLHKQKAGKAPPKGKAASSTPVRQAKLPQD